MPRLNAERCPDDEESSAVKDGPLSVHFGYAQYGWVGLSLLGAGGGPGVVVHCSNVFDPFDDLLAWLHSVADGALPAVLTINEEGSCQRLEAHRYTGRYAHHSDIEFKVAALDWDGAELPDTPCRMRLRTTRAQLLQEFARRLAAWLQHDYAPDDWYHLEQDEFETWTEFAQALQRVDLRQRLDVASLLRRLPQTGAA